MHTISVEELENLDPSNITILDIRSEEDFRQGFFSGSHQYSHEKKSGRGQQRRKAFLSRVPSKHWKKTFRQTNRSIFSATPESRARKPSKS